MTERQNLLTMFDRAISHIKDAHNDLQREGPEAAVDHTRMGREILQRAEEILATIDPE